MQVSGRVAVVTGGARGIGRAIAARLVAAGARVAIADLDEVAAVTTAEELGARGYGVDVRDGAGVAALARAVGADLGPIDVWVNNAGVMVLGAFLDADPASDRLQLDVNVLGAVNGMRAALPSMVARRTGHIVNVASTAGRVGVAHAAMYCASKHAVVGLTEAVRAEHLGSGVGFTMVLPGLVDTDLLDGVPRLSWPPTATPDDVAVAVVRAISRGEVEVYVPRGARLAKILPALLPRFVNEAIGRWVGADDVFVRTDHGARSRYAARVRGG
jgi:NAD(P)-dependent dehydrogenase (short-subunit alcohol dehydrogenase family)